MSSTAIAGQVDVLPFPGSGSLRRRVLGLAAPAIGENLLQTLLGIVDTLLVARLGAEAIAGVGSSMQVMFFVIGVLSAISVGGSILVSQAIGAGRQHTANHVAKQAIVWGVVLAVPLSVGGFLLADQITTWLALPPEVAPITADYIRVTLGGSVFIVMMYVAGGLLRGAGDSRTPMLAALLANVLNAVLAVLLIFGHLGLPALGTQGSAWATLTGRAVAACIVLAVLASGLRAVSIRGAAGWLPNLAIAGRICNLGLPAAAEQALITLGFTVFTALMATQGTGVLAAQRIAFNALSLAFLPAIGFMLATTALVGMSVGARAPALGGAATNVAARWTVGWMTAIGLIYILAAGPVVHLFSEDGRVVSEAEAMLRIIALAQPSWALVFIFSGALRGLGNTRFPLVVNTAGIWATIGLAYVLINYLGAGPVLPWFGFVVLSPVSGALVWWRFRREVRGQVVAVLPGRRVGVAPAVLGDG